MGETVSRILEVEKVNWVKPHNLNYNTDLRNRQLPLINNFKRNLKLCYKERTLYGINYQHWYVTDGRWTIEFGGGEISNAEVQVHCNSKGHEEIISTLFLMDQGVKNRMKKVCGATNYSLALRNCEHLARYIHSGAWICLQMLGSGILKKTFFDAMAQHTKVINTLPRELEEEEHPIVEIYRNIDGYATFEKSDHMLTEADKDSLNILFLGPTGSGKSSLINTIFNKTVSKTASTAQSVGKEVKFYKGSLTRRERVNAQWRTVTKKMIAIDTIGIFLNIYASKTT